MAMTQIKTISVLLLKQLMDQNPNLCLIDIREPQEWSEAHIPNVLHIPKQDLAGYCLAQNIPYSQDIYLHCRSGMRSMAAAEQLQSMGYQSVYSVEGGIVAWENAGYPISHHTQQ
ncbi:MAG TPA: rhodanese-like domain-containing protein [Legionellaceae bacterium]|nr:rhodanese-like domain-containing protein [Legionellaceae bacterium]